MSRIEIAAVIFGIISVYLSVRQNIWSWATGIVNVTLYVFVFYGVKLYADMGLQVVYIGLSFYGWYNWLYGGKDQTQLRVSKTTRTVGALLLIIVVGGSLLLGQLLYRGTDASLPFLDSMTTTVSLVAQWMMTRKLLESWLVWIAVDVVYVGMFIYKELFLTASLYAVFLLLAVKGFYDWKKSWRETSVAA